MRRPHSGFTLTEVLLTLSLFSTLLLTVFSIFTTAQQNYFTSVGVQQAQLRTTSTIEMLRDDLLGAKIVGNPVSHNAGQGMVYVMFQRLDPDTMGQWEEQSTWEDSSTYMYLWCSQVQPVPAPCNQFPDPAPKASQLVLARSATGNINAPWVVERVMIGNMDTTMGSVEANDPETYPFQLTITNGSVTLMRILTVGTIFGLSGERLIKEDRQVSFRLRNPQA